ncbi:UDP-N-acetylglucosamine 1-carboxyvinyltransferase [Halarsenatibacter silvermanii]|uniref:UDP-N-acetylglucosamine 1-carboxyvinyltransferase n=1 Tax=Halarsenatibacter silvermanii TaxID=321763 RepID=A0A1G9HV03_9FIRM|nr:UDP-N-acetylglucosamine 1-carboxyvinyltransferase [Halarsenatibacter silvermanii]SDL16656.1 UDP-N-acetylglucosamine 1-carboxyvinyltransferase [Halarsenatibacter silvermanii]
MDKFHIEQSPSLSGRVRISGAKNAALPIIAAALLPDSPCRLKEIPALNDVKNLARIVECMGAEVEYEESSMTIDPRTLDCFEADPELASQLRASYYILGVMLAREGRACTSLPGGCRIGSRPIDLHLKGFKALGAEVSIEEGCVEVWTENGLTGGDIYLDYPSVGATINIMLAASRAEGKTTIENAAREPEIVDLANFLTVMGAGIKGVGTDVIRIEGVDEMQGVEHEIIPDRIEAGTYIIAGALAGEDVFVENVLDEHLKPLLAKLREMGVELEQDISGVRVARPKKLRSVDVKTFPYPGFPTDLQAQMMVLLTQAESSSVVTETVWEDRFSHVDELNKMGASIQLDDNSALINPSSLKGAEVTAPDLRAGAALMLAGLIADGETMIDEVDHIRRGYENIIEKISGLGGRIKQVRDRKNQVTTA